MAVSLKERKEERNKQDAEAATAVALANRVGTGVIDLLGKPQDYHDVQARNVHFNRFRVNVRVEVQQQLETCCIKLIKILHSYYVFTDDDGNITDSSPKIERLYNAS